jgi:membrane associated rhomboid family serine protease
MTVHDNDTPTLEQARQQLLGSVRWPTAAVVLLWIIHIHQETANWDPGNYGIVSRQVFGIWGILTGPLVHGSWNHLMSNTVPLFVLSALCLFFYRKVARRAIAMIYLLTGVTVWLFARPVSHIGISGVVYGLVAFIFWNGIFRRNFRSIILALLVMLFYSGMFIGIFPDQEGISWESHLLGSLTGIFTAFWFREELEEEEAAPPDPFADERGVEAQPWLPADAFNMTKLERAEAEALEQQQRLMQQRQLPPSDGFWVQDSTWS